MGYDITEKDLAKKHAGMIHNIVQKISSHQNNYDDLYQIGLDYLFKCHGRYDKSKASFSTFAYISIKRAIIKRNIQIVKRCKQELLYSPKNINHDYCNTYEASGVTSIKNACSHPDTSFDIRDVISNSNISDRQHKILEMKIKSMTLAEIGENLGITPERVRQIHEQTKEELAKIMTK